MCSATNYVLTLYIYLSSTAVAVDIYVKALLCRKALGSSKSYDLRGTAQLQELLLSTHLACKSHIQHCTLDWCWENMEAVRKLPLLPLLLPCAYTFCSRSHQPEEEENKGKKNKPRERENIWDPFSHVYISTIST